MPNHYQNIMIFHGYTDKEFNAVEFAKEHRDTNWCAEVRPVSKDSQCEEQREAWGVKWGAYDTQAMKLEGDGSPVIIAFQTPWGPPKKDVLGLIGQYICKLCGFSGFAAVAFDPYDNSLDVNVDMVPVSNGE